MKIEALFGEVCGMNGDVWNAEYLHRSVPSAEMYATLLTETPYFASGVPDIICIGSMTESTQKKVIEKLRPLASRLKELIDGGTIILATGNAGDIFSRSIVNITDGTVTKGLGILANEVRVDMLGRFHGKTLGSFRGMEIVGFQCRFGFWHGISGHTPFLQIERGMGDCAGCKTEGYVINNFFCTSLLGPILPLNPKFTEYLISCAGEKGSAAYRDEAMASYQRRLAEFTDPRVRFE
ncbi:MAG: glutamine amidotransferase [Clostridia bacterium]|nr:glutamine amidotransferase [Clostridia bacterium]